MLLIKEMFHIREKKDKRKINKGLKNVAYCI